MGLETYKGIIFDSKEEVWFAMWCEELKKAGYIKRWSKVKLPINLFMPVSFDYKKITKLKTKTKEEWKKFTLLQDLEYTPDFEIEWNLNAFELKNVLSTLEADGINPKSLFFIDVSLTGFVEVKPIFDQHGKTARFSIIQKIIWNVKDIFVDLIIPEDLFEGTFMPLEAIPDFKYKKAPRTGQWKTKYIPKTLKQFLDEN